MLLKETVEVLGGKTLFRRAIRTPDDLAHVIRSGLPVLSVSNVVHRFARAPSPEALKIQYFFVPEGTYKRRLKLGKLSVEEGEKTTRFAHLFATAKHVLGDEDDARLFLNSPHWELHDRKPVDVAETEIGARQVEDLLWKIFYGVPA
jgi:putative toxin-antitoxin system antitoxin component (TIGR02293 family)